MSCSQKRRDELRCATWTTVAIATTYLCCSSLSLFISVLENVLPGNALLFNEEGSRCRHPAAIEYLFQYSILHLSYGCRQYPSSCQQSSPFIRLFALQSFLQVEAVNNPIPLLFRKQFVDEFPLFKRCCSWESKQSKDVRYTQVGYQNLMMSCGPHPQHPVML